MNACSHREDRLWYERRWMCSHILHTIILLIMHFERIEFQMGTFAENLEAETFI